MATMPQNNIPHTLFFVSGSIELEQMRYSGNFWDRGVDHNDEDDKNDDDEDDDDVDADDDVYLFFNFIFLLISCLSNQVVAIPLAGKITAADFKKWWPRKSRKLHGAMR